MVSASSALATGSNPPAAAPIRKHMNRFHQKDGIAPQMEVPTNMSPEEGNLTPNIAALVNDNEVNRRILEEQTRRRGLCFRSQTRRQGPRHDRTCEIPPSHLHAALLICLCELGS
jgi:hypothetical protein